VFGYIKIKPKVTHYKKSLGGTYWTSLWMRVVDNEYASYDEACSKPSADIRKSDKREIFFNSLTVKKCAKWFPFKRKSQQNRSSLLEHIL